MTTLDEHIDVCGTLSLPGESGYDRARRARNLRADLRPAAVLTAANVDDVRAGVRYAEASGLGVAVLATGHGTGLAADSGALLINTSRLGQVTVNPVARRARVGAGAIWHDVIAATRPYGLTGLPGSSPDVGVVGYTLGGGFGWLGRRFGLAAHSVTGAEVVTSGGRLIEVGPQTHPDLFWALGGGSGNFGVVTALEFALYPVAEVYAGNLYYPLERSRDLLEFMAEWSRTVPDELTSAVTFRAFPPAPTLPEALQGKSLVALRGAHCGNLDQARALIDEARRSLGTAVIDTFGRLPTSALAQVSLDPPDPLPFLGRSELLADLTPGTVDAVLGLSGPDAGSPLVMFELRQLGGALAGPPGALSPMAHTKARFSVNAIGVPLDPGREQVIRDHLGQVAIDLTPHVTGDTYLNFLDLDGATPQRIRAAYSPGDLARLHSVKAAYDSANTFRFNRNLPPIGTSHE